MKIRKKIRNAIGVLIVRYVIHNDLKNNTEGWLVTRKNGTQQVIKVFSRQAYENVVRPAVLHKQNTDNQPRVTNADRIRSMSDEELSEFIGKFLESMSDCENCPAKTEVFLCVSCADEILDWLRKEVEE